MRQCWIRSRPGLGHGDIITPLSRMSKAVWARNCAGNILIYLKLTVYRWLSGLNTVESSTTLVLGHELSVLLLFL